MKVWRKIVAVLILLPFVVSVSGVVVFHTHCHCTGRNVTSLFVLPESCEDLEADHEHLFGDHAGDLQACCMPQDTSGESSPEEDCGCHSPRVEFFKLKQQFTSDKSGHQYRALETVPFLLPGILAPESPDLRALQSVVLPPGEPPVVTPGTDIIHIICQPKIPGLI